jgi:hypothetical protein
VGARLSRYNSPSHIALQHQKGPKITGNTASQFKRPAKELHSSCLETIVCPKTIFISEDQISARPSPQFTTLGKAARQRKQNTQQIDAVPLLATHTCMCTQAEHIHTKPPKSKHAVSLLARSKERVSRLWSLKKQQQHRKRRDRQYKTDGVR